MLCMLIYFQKRNKFEDIHCQRAWTLNSHLTVVHVEPGHLVSWASTGRSISSLVIRPLYSLRLSPFSKWLTLGDSGGGGATDIPTKQMHNNSLRNIFWNIKINLRSIDQGFKVNSTRAFQKIDFNWLIGIILVWDKLNLIHKSTNTPNPTSSS